MNCCHGNGSGWTCARRLELWRQSLPVFTIRRAAQILGRDEELLWKLLQQLDPEDGLLWVYDVNDDEAVPAFTDFGIENLREIIKDQIDKAD
jgi:hypothetical protein